MAVDLQTYAHAPIYEKKLWAIVDSTSLFEISQ